MGLPSSLAGDFSLNDVAIVKTEMLGDFEVAVAPEKVEFGGSG
jgi:hypothetical protein